MAQTVSHWTRATYVLVESQASPCWIFGGIGEVFSNSTSVSSCQIHTAEALYILVHSRHNIISTIYSVVKQH
jgi:hypothetical protein